MRRAGPASGALAVDLDSGGRVYALRAGAARVPASVEKLYTTATALRRLGAAARLTHAGQRHRRPGRRGHRRGRPLPPRRRRPDVRRARPRAARGRGGGGRRGHGDGPRGRRRDGVRRLPRPAVVGLPALPLRRAAERADLQPRADREAVALLPGPAGALRGPRPHARSCGAGAWSSARAAAVGATPAGAVPLAEWASPPMVELARLTNVPSDNFSAETLLKVLGAQFAGVGQHRGGRHRGPRRAGAAGPPARRRGRLGALAREPDLPAPGGRPPARHGRGGGLPGLARRRRPHRDAARRACAAPPRRTAAGRRRAR